MNKAAQEGLKNKVLNKVFRYEEGTMTRKEWLEFHKNNGAKLNGAELKLNDNSFYNLTKTEIEYFNSLKGWIYEEEKDNWSTKLDGMDYFIDAESLIELISEAIIISKTLYKEPLTQDEFIEEFSIYKNNKWIDPDKVKELLITK